MSRKSIEKVGEMRTSNITIVVGIGTGIIFVAATVLYIVFSGIRDEIIFTLSAFVGWGAVYSAYFVGETLRVQIEQKNMDLRQQRIDRSFALKGEFDEPQLIEFRTKVENMVRKIREEHLGMEDEECSQALYERIANDPEMLTAARSILNKMESASLAVQFGNADELVLYRDLSVIIVNTYRNLEFFVGMRRKREDVYNAKRAFRETEKLVESWEKRRLLSTGEEVSE